MPEGNPATLVFGHVLESRLEALFHAGDRVLELDGPRSAAASRLEARGVRVAALDPARARTEAGGSFDGAFAASAFLDGADLIAIGPALGAALRPGAPVLLTLLGPWPLPALLRRTLTGAGERRRGEDPQTRRVARPPSYPTLGEARRALGPSFEWTDAYALGVLLPDATREAWVRDHPQGFAMLAMMERVVRRWPGVRQLGDRLVLEGRRAVPA
jgi:hypothetical protein